MSHNQKIQQGNQKIFALMSHYLNSASDYIEQEEIDALVETGVTEAYAFRVILATAFGLDIIDDIEDRGFFNHYFDQMIHKLDINDYTSNLYYQSIKMPSIKIGKSELKYEKYQPYEGFVFNDIIKQTDGRQIPQIGFFPSAFKFPAILEDGRIWMTITPNEIETMKEPVADAFGNVLTYGLGLGYYAYMVSEKENVSQVTVVEKNQDVIELFEEHLLPQFKHAEKVKIIKADAYDYAENQMAKGKYDFVFTDLWHDVSDGIDLYLKMKQYEQFSPDANFAYWIEKSILCYL